MAADSRPEALKVLDCDPIAAQGGLRYEGEDVDVAMEALMPGLDLEQAEVAAQLQERNAI